MALYDISGKVIKADKKKKKPTTSQKILGTAGTLATEVGRGFLGAAEGAADLALYGLSGASKLAGNELLSTSFREAAQQRSTDKALKTASQTYRPTTVTKKGGLAETLASGVGQVGAIVGGSRALPTKLASVKAGKLTLPTTSLITGAGSGMSQAFERGASTPEAALYGAGKGTVEGITEGLFGGLGKTFNKLTGGAALDDAVVGRLTKNITNKFTKNLASVGIKSAGEGVEEVLSSIMDPLLQKATFEQNVDLKELYKNTDLLEDFVVGALISGIVQSPSLITDGGKLDINPETKRELGIEQAFTQPTKAITSPTTAETPQTGINIPTQTQNSVEMAENREISDIKGKTPLIVYHGSPIKGITQLDVAKSGTNTQAEKGVLYFTNNPKFAEDFSYERIPTNSSFIEKKGAKGEVYTAELDIKKPLDLTNLTMEDAINIANTSPTKFYDANKVMELSKMPNGQLLKTELNIPELKKLGYDGIIAKVESGFGENKVEAYEYGVFDNSQIKMIKEKTSQPKTQKKTVEPPKIAQQPTPIEPTTETPKQTQFVKTAEGSEMLDNPEYKKALDKIGGQYAPQSNKATLDIANNVIGTKGYDSAVTLFNGKFDGNDRIKATDIALGERLIQEAVKKGDYQAAADITEKTALLLTEAGQAVQAARIIQNLTPEGQLRMTMRMVDRLNTKMATGQIDSKLKKELRGKQKGLVMTPKMQEKILSAKDKKTLDKNVQEVQQELADQLAPTLGDRVSAWRYFAMLTNPVTHIRNIAGNIVNTGAIQLKNLQAGALQDLIQKINPKVFENEVRTKTLKKPTKTVTDFASKVSAELEGTGIANNKYSDSAGILNKKKSTNWKPLQKGYDLSSGVLTLEDTIFRTYAFKRSFSNYLMANGIDTQSKIDANPQLVEQAKSFATEESLTAVFQQYNALASALNGFKRMGKIGGKRGMSAKVASFGLDAYLPFTKTPANIAAQAIEYSPAGLMKTIVGDTAKLNSGQITVTQYLDNLTKGMTGTMIFTLGTYLAAMGILSGADEDDKEGEYDKALGKQQYSVRIGNKSYSIDWAVPIAMPLLVGVETYRQFKEKGAEAISGNTLADLTFSSVNPMIEMSFLQGITNAISGFNENKIQGLAEAGIKSYIGQFTPTLGGQINRVVDPTVRLTSPSKDSPWTLGEGIIRTAISKTPGASIWLEPATDLWGNEIKRSENVMQRAVENLILPTRISKDITQNIDKELKSLYVKTGEDRILPKSYLNKYVQFGGEKYDTNAKEYTQYKKTYGTVAGNNLDKLFNTNAYKNATEEDKITMIGNVYKLASDTAKKQFLSGRGVSYTNATKDGVDYYRANNIETTINEDISYEAAKYKNRYADKYNAVTLIADYDTYAKYQDKISNIRANLKNASTDQRKAATYKYINSLPLNKTKKAMLFKQYYSSFKDADRTILETINKMDLTKAEKLAIAEDYGFKVVNGKIII